ncbi:MAG: hypothetical protein AVDCRST_MAG73-2359 [uncultured Thermomicrobiales bacterium]|uniref:Uncharacterized protein n=1 Tax=uncultured Thermomicrobiales bacterium TaxID=1645740 RepID=A0A6J4UDG7_9BACT|nr:MAG: hypothetical protein AVDCRST_MAG73-2359 [uncultured Thermomicrobiales bacterium]
MQYSIFTGSVAGVGSVIGTILRCRPNRSAPDGTGVAPVANAVPRRGGGSW